MIQCTVIGMSGGRRAARGAKGAQDLGGPVDAPGGVAVVHRYRQDARRVVDGGLVAAEELGPRLAPVHRREDALPGQVAQQRVPDRFRGAQDLDIERYRAWRAVAERAPRLTLPKKRRDQLARVVGAYRPQPPHVQQRQDGAGEGGRPCCTVAQAELTGLLQGPELRLADVLAGKPGRLEDHRDELPLRGRTLVARRRRKVLAPGGPHDRTVGYRQRLAK